jgi:hypothetical protein
MIGIMQHGRPVVHRQARRLLPVILGEQDWNAGLGEAIRADERVKPVIAEGRHRGPRDPFVV